MQNCCSSTSTEQNCEVISPQTNFFSSLHQSGSKSSCNNKLTSSPNSKGITTTPINYLTIGTNAKEISTVISLGSPETKYTTPEQVQLKAKPPSLLITGDLVFNKELIINDKGVKYSSEAKAAKGDKVTYFGIGTKENDVIVKNILHLKESDNNRLFGIKYDKKKLMYVIFLKYPSLSLYCLLQDVFYFSLVNNTYRLKLGTIDVRFTPINFSATKNAIEIIVVLDSQEIKMFFEDSQMPITIGRQNCGINIQHQSISKQHGLIAYSQSVKNFYYNDTQSRNGTFITLQEGYSLPIQGEMFFLLGESYFKVYELKPQLVFI